MQIKLQNSHMQKEKNQTVLERKQQMDISLPAALHLYCSRSPFGDALWLLKIRYIDTGF